MKRHHTETQTQTRPIAQDVLPTLLDLPSKHKKEKPLHWRILLSRHYRPACLLSAAIFSLIALHRWTGCRLSPVQRVILTASHLRSGPDGELRLRIITHNLKQLHNELDNNLDNLPVRSTVIFSHDPDDDSITETISQWQSSVKGMVNEIKLVPNDAINVDVSKWMTVLDSPSFPPSEVMLVNDSFLLLRPPKLWNCEGVCGLAWTAPKTDGARHFQSYVRTLSPCAARAYANFVRRTEKAKSVQELIQNLEVNLSWARGVGAEALYECEGGHPDEDEVQRRLMRRGYPALKLKKFFETEDPWLVKRRALGDSVGAAAGGIGAGNVDHVSPYLDLQIYRSKNHDLNHLSDTELTNHFAELGWKENRIYSKLPLVMKGWLKEEVETLEDNEEVMGILVDYLGVLNRGNKT